MTWGSPNMLMLLWLLLPLGVALLYLLRRRLRRLRLLADAPALSILMAGWSAARWKCRHVLWFAAIGFCLLALARPQWGFHWEEARRRGLDIIVVLDTSRSMLAEDIKPNRLEQAKWGVRDLVRRLRGDRVGLIPFAGGSILQCPLTMDYAAFLMTLDDIHVGIIPRGGTAIAQALRTAMDSFEKTTESDRAIILITDGEDTVGQPLALLDELKHRNIRVFTVGIGSLEGELIPVKDEAGRSVFLKDRAGNVVKSSLNEPVLERLAVGTGGIYIRAVPGDLGMDRIVDQGLAPLKRRELESKMTKVFEDRFPWLLGMALLLLAIEAGLREQNRKIAEGSA